MFDILIILFALIDIFILYLCADHKDYHQASKFMFYWIISQPIYWMILVLIFDRRV